ncbi:MAG TPA: hypothetical protein VJ508_07830, partial [Saprospiraceae bacterium]|nr:hypothetical protein [Saprospiraceae bacterium]
MRPRTPFPHPLISVYVFLLAGLFSLPFNAYAQAQLLSRKAQRHAYIDSIYHAAQARHLDTDAPLRYDFWFVDREKGTLTELTKRLTKDSFELESVKPAGKKWKMNLFINAAIPKASMNDLDKKLRRLRYDYLVDEY